MFVFSYIILEFFVSSFFPVLFIGFITLCFSWAIALFRSYPLVCPQRWFSTYVFWILFVLRLILLCFNIFGFSSVFCLFPPCYPLLPSFNSSPPPHSLSLPSDCLNNYTFQGSNISLATYMTK